MRGKTLVRRKSILTGIERWQELPVTQEQLTDFETGRAPIQHVLPWLSTEQQEFLLTGIVPDEWEIQSEKHGEGQE